MGTKYLGNGDDTFRAYEEGGIGPFFEDWYSWTINGNGGNDKIWGGQLGDTITGDSGNDVLDGRDGADKLFGGIGNDILYGDGDYRSFDSDVDTLDGGADNDTYYADANDIIVDSSGIDTLHLMPGSSDGYRDYALSSSIEKLVIGNGYESYMGRVFANDLDNEIQVNGMGYGTLVEGRGGKDIMFGADGTNYFRGGAGNDALGGGVGNDILVGDGDSDGLVGVNGSGTSGGGRGEIDQLEGGTGNDTFYLGFRAHCFYDDGNAGTAGANDYAVINDFSSGDKIVLAGYSNEYALRAGNYTGIGSSDRNDTAIVRVRSGQLDETIGYIKDQTGFSLTNTNTFQYLGY